MLCPAAVVVLRKVCVGFMMCYDMMLHDTISPHTHTHLTVCFNYISKLQLNWK